jgi:hypothetical protein
MNIEQLLADQEALHQVAHWKARYLQAEDRNRDLTEKCRVLSVQLGALKAQLSNSNSSNAASAALPIPTVAPADDESGSIVHSPKSPPNSAAIVARLRQGVELEFKQRFAALEADLEHRNALVAQQQRDAGVLAQDRELLRSQVTELSAQKQLLAAENAELKRSVADMQTALLQMSQQVESLAARTVQ